MKMFKKYLNSSRNYISTIINIHYYLKIIIILIIVLIKIIIKIIIKI